MSYPVSANNRIYTVVDDLQSSYQVLVSVLVQDALTQEAPAGELTVTLQQNPSQTDIEALRRLIFIKIAEGGLFCLAGEAARVTPSTFDLQIHVPGYVDASQPVNILQGSNFPLTFTIPMQRLPIRIQGRVVASAVNTTVIPGAQVRFVDEPNPPLQVKEHVAALRMPLHLDLVPPTKAPTKVRQRQLNLGGVEKQLIASATLGDKTLTFKDQTGLAVGDVLFISTPVAEEYVLVDSLSSQVPGQVLLHSPLNHSYAVGTAVQKYTSGTIGTETTLTQQAKAGDGVLFLQNQLPVDTIEIVDATGTPVEYSALGAITDADGYYRLDGINRVRTVYMEASATGFKAMAEPTAWTIDYAQPVNTVDFRLHP